MATVAELAHHPDRLDLGSEGRVLTIWMCNNEDFTLGECYFGSWESGCNLAVIADLSTREPVTPPKEVAGTAYIELEIVAWSEDDDGVPSSLFPVFFTDEYYKINREDFKLWRNRSSLGGTPSWIQSPSEAPPPPYRFAGEFWDQVRTKSPNYGTGIAYLFVDPDSATAKFFWQC